MGVKCEAIWKLLIIQLDCRMIFHQLGVKRKSMKVDFIKQNACNTLLEKN